MRGVVAVAVGDVVVRGRVADGSLVVAVVVVVIGREVRGSKRGRNLVVDAMVSVSSSGSVPDRNWCDEESINWPDVEGK